MRWMLLTLVMVAGCGAKPPPQATLAENVENAQAPGRSEGSVKRARMPRPAIDLSLYTPDFHDDLRWPLSSMTHPSLEPRFPIARELAIGVSWQQLCARGVHKRVSATKRELLSYLHGWCDVLKRDIDGACKHLAPLLGSTRLGLTQAIRQDLANILVSSGDADQAEHHLSKHHIRDIEVIDLLAANYVEVGSPHDAAAIIRRAIDSDDHPTDATRCQRLVKRIATRSEADPTEALDALTTLATRRKIADPSCVRLNNKVACWQSPERGCEPYFRDENISLLVQSLLRAYYRWPGTARMETWWHVADVARNAMPMPEAAELALAAFDASLIADPSCAGDRAIDVNHMIEVIRGEPALASFHSDARLARMAKLCPKPELPSGASAHIGSASAGPPPPSIRPKPVATWPSSP